MKTSQKKKNTTDNITHEQKLKKFDNEKQTESENIYVYKHMTYMTIHYPRGYFWNVSRTQEGHSVRLII